MLWPMDLKKKNMLTKESIDIYEEKKEEDN